jgi:hypothetical protein
LKTAIGIIEQNSNQGGFMKESILAKRQVLLGLEDMEASPPESRKKPEAESPPGQGPNPTTLTQPSADPKWSAA